MSPKDVEELRQLLGAFAAFSKAAAPGEVVATRLGPASPPPLDPATLGKEELRRLVHVADLMAAALPDNAERPWDPARQELASRLRKLYFDIHGENAYPSD